MHFLEMTNTDALALAGATGVVCITLTLTGVFIVNKIRDKRNYNRRGQ